MKSLIPPKDRFKSTFLHANDKGRSASSVLGLFFLASLSQIAKFSAKLLKDITQKVSKLLAAGIDDILKDFKESLSSIVSQGKLFRNIEAPKTPFSPHKSSL